MSKDFKDISIQISEEEYRKDPALSYSTLARYEREGFNNLSKLFDRVESPSLTFGSAVDSIITGGSEEFNQRFIVADYPSVPDSIISIVKELFSRNSSNFENLSDIPDSEIINLTEEFKYQLNWKPETRAKVIKEKGETYYKLLYILRDKTLIDTLTYQDICNTCTALKGSMATREYFKEDNPFDGIKRYYQLKFKATFEEIDYRCMADLIIVDYNKKIVYPIDLKTSSHTEWDFYKSFAEWRYDIQARLYWRIIRQNMDKDEFFKDFKLEDYRFIVVNKRTLVPLVWQFFSTQAVGELTYGKLNDKVFRDPFVIGKELKGYLDYECNVPNEIDETEPNNIMLWLNRL